MIVGLIPKKKINEMLKELEEKTTELPEWTASDKGKVLKVNAAGTALEWATDAT